ncbi:MAG: MinD/ParA family protein [Candidatus Nanoarchaeia archaeon]|nr:MinD/ParA family protein [Candidatus Nanoarchaeia archaeon]
MVDKKLQDIKEEVMQGEIKPETNAKTDSKIEKPAEKAKPKKPRVIAVLSGKGGVGKTTLTANLGAALAYDYNRNVVAVDANTTSAGLGLYLGEYFYKNTINDVIKRGIDLSEALYCHPSGLKLLPASADIADSDADPKKIKQVVDIVSTYSDFVLLDCPPTLGDETTSGIEASNECIVVVNPEWASLLEAKRTIDYVSSKKKSVLGLVLNRTNGDIDEYYVKNVEEVLNSPVLAIIPEDNYVKDSIEKRVPVVHLHPKSEASRNMKVLLEKITGQAFPKRKGFWQTLFGM